MVLKTICVAVMLVTLQAVTAVRADTKLDLAACADERVKTAMLSLKQLATAEAACTRVLGGSASEHVLQNAAFFRGLIKFLQVVQKGVALKPNADGSMPVYKLPTKQEVASALADVETTIKLGGPLKGDALALRITIYQTIGQKEDVSGDLEAAVGAAPDNPTPLVQRVLEAERRGDSGAALADLNRAVELDPKSGPALMSRASLLMRVGHLAKARTDLIAAIALGLPFRRLALIQKSQIEARTGDLRASLDDLLSATRETGDMSAEDALKMNIDFLIRAGDLALNSLKDPDTAESVFKEVAGLAPESWHWVLGLGRVAEARGEGANAIEIYNRILNGTKKQPNLFERNDASWRLKRLTQPILQRRAGEFIPGFEFGVITEKPAGDGLKRLALIIGSGNYAELPNLPNARRDATVIANRLADMGFDKVEIAEDISSANLIDLPTYVADRARENDIIVVFYAGHGIEIGGINYLVPVDATLETEKNLGSTALALEKLTAAAANARRGALVIIDACRDDPFVDAKFVAASRSAAGEKDGTIPETMHMGLAVSPTPAPNNVVLHSTQPGKTAADGDGLDSPFVMALLQTLSTPGLTLNEIVQETSTRVSELTGGEQIPTAYGQKSTVNILPTGARN